MAEAGGGGAWAVSTPNESPTNRDLGVLIESFLIEFVLFIKKIPKRNALLSNYITQ